MQERRKFNYCMLLSNMLLTERLSALPRVARCADVTPWIFSGCVHEERAAISVQLYELLYSESHQTCGQQGAILTTMLPCAPPHTPECTCAATHINT